MRRPAPIRRADQCGQLVYNAAQAPFAVKKGCIGSMRAPGYVPKVAKK